MNSSAAWGNRGELGVFQRGSAIEGGPIINKLVN